MTVRIAPEPFTDMSPGQWNRRILGPVWTEVRGNRNDRWFIVDRPIARGLRRFIQSAITMAPEDVAYGTAYAVVLGDEEVTEGPWHYDLGEYRADGALRYLATWASDREPLQNVFQSEGEDIQPANNMVVEFNEGTDYHRRPHVPARPGAWGVFASLALYRDDEPANLDCPRVSELADRGERGRQAGGHRPVKREVY